MSADSPRTTAEDPSNPPQPDGGGYLDGVAGLGSDAAEAVGSAIAAAQAATIGRLKDFVWGLFRTLFKGIFIIPAALVGMVAWVFLGSDRQLQRTVEGFPGIADFPVFLANIVVDALEPIGSTILTVIAGTNLTLVSAVAGDAGILSLALLFVLQTVEIGILVYALWAGAQFAGAVPIVGPVLSTTGTVVMRPFKAVLEVIR